MREQRSGQIVNISSVSGILAMPTMSSYSASKHALEGATEALWYETQPFGINVNLVELGFIKSDAFKNVILSNKAQMSSLIDGPHSEYYTSMTPFIEKLMSMSLTSSRSAAKRISSIIDKNSSKLRFAGTPDVLLFSFMKRILPSSWQNRLFYSLLPHSIKWGGHWKKELNFKTKLNPPLHW
jgi:short-subunit dehydrogenase